MLFLKQSTNFLRKLGNFPSGAFYSTEGEGGLQLGTKEY